MSSRPITRASVEQHLLVYPEGAAEEQLQKDFACHKDSHNRRLAETLKRLKRWPKAVWRAPR